MMLSDFALRGKLEKNLVVFGFGQQEGRTSKSCTTSLRVVLGCDVTLRHVMLSTLFEFFHVMMQMNGT